MGSLAVTWSFPSLRPARLAAVACCVALGAHAAAAAGDVRVLFSFEEDDDGGYADTDLVRDAAGNLYGMAVQGGAFHGGTVFQLAPTGNGWALNVLHEFTGGPDGGQPYGGVTLDAQGNVYGTAVIGGSGGPCNEDGCGVVFKLTHTGGSWTQTVIHDFTGGSDGFGPGGAVVFDSHGRILGMTPTGGDFNSGVIFQLTPQPDGSWTEQIVHTFTGGDDGGSGSAGRLLVDPGGSVFGVTTVGGTSGAGTAFELVPGPGDTWDFQTLHSFAGQPGAGFPYGGLVRDAAGALYGTTYYDGAVDLGCIYRLQLVNGTWTETVLHSFKGGRDGAGSIAGLVFGSNGELYGTTAEGGASCSCGTIFKLEPQPGGAWKESILHRFTGVADGDGAYAYAGLLSDGAGSFFGATVRGGADDDGALYRFTP